MPLAPTEDEEVKATLVFTTAQLKKTITFGVVVTSTVVNNTVVLHISMATKCDTWSHIVYVLTLVKCN